MNEPKSERQGTLRVSTPRPRVIETSYTGHISPSLAEDHEADFIVALSRHPATHWLVDTMAVTSVDPQTALAARSWLTAFKSQGGHTMVLASQSGAVRLLATTLSFAAGIAIKAFESKEDAIAALPSS